MNFKVLKTNINKKYFMELVTSWHFKRTNLSNQMMKNRKNINDKKNQKLQSENYMSKKSVMNHLYLAVS